MGWQGTIRITIYQQVGHSVKLTQITQVKGQCNGLYLRGNGTKIGIQTMIQYGIGKSPNSVSIAMG